MSLLVLISAIHTSTVQKIVDKNIQQPVDEILQVRYSI